MSSDSDVNLIAEASKPDAPSMAAPLSGEVSLIRGLQDEEGNWHREAKVRELNGQDEEELAELGGSEMTYPEYMTAVLERSVLSIGGLPGKGNVGKLILADRDILYHGTIKCTYGVEKEIAVTCRACEKKQNWILNLDDDFPVFRPEDFDATEPVSIELKNGTVQFNLPTGDAAHLAASKSKNTPELNTYIIAQCVVTKDDLDLDQRLKWARELSIPDRKKVEQRLKDLTDDLGPKLGEVNTQCQHCSAELPILMDWVSLLLG